MVKVKICGITNEEDALAAVEAGADSLGFVFAESPRKIGIYTAASIIKELPAHIGSVGVFADQEADEIFRIMEAAKLHLAQIHGGIEGPFDPLNEGVRWGVVRALRLASAEDVYKAAEDHLIAICEALLLDAHVEGKMGGTGQTFDWKLALQAERYNKPIILAGGLTPENVAEAVRMVRPYAVDVSTGVEESPGEKDHAKIKEFVKNAKNA